MKNLLITLTEEQYALACIRLLDPEIHLQNFAEVMVHNSMQQLGYQQQVDGGYKDSDIQSALKNPSAQQKQQELEARRIKDNEEAEAANVERKRAEAVEAKAALQHSAEQDKARQAAEQAEIEARAVVLARAMMQTLARPDQPRIEMHDVVATLETPQGTKSLLATAPASDEVKPPMTLGEHVASQLRGSESADIPIKTKAGA